MMMGAQQQVEEKYNYWIQLAARMSVFESLQTCLVGAVDQGTPPH